jgi:ABC-type dipeptide/oligopeptide/nickel transport system ATPase component
MEILLKIDNLTTYCEDKKIVDGVSFDIKKNEVVALFGECGCGKLQQHILSWG